MGSLELAVSRLAAEKSDYPGVALVTGAASGIGRATAIAFAISGCRRLALLDLNEAGLAETKGRILDLVKPDHEIFDIEAFRIDVVSADNVSSVYAAVKARFSRIDYAVQCAGVAANGTSTETSIEQFDRATAVNYRGLWLCTRQTLQIMADQQLDSEVYPHAGIHPVRAQRGAIVNLSSDLAYRSQPKSAAYIGSKGAVSALTRADAIDYIGLKIRVNAVLPGIVDSPMTNPNPEIRQWLEEVAVKHTPAQRFGLPEEIADVAVFLTSNKASLVTGANWAVDGGNLAGHC